jgi:hypothetical protein
VPKNSKDPNIKPEDKENLIDLVDENMVEGIFKIKLKHARGLKESDTKALGSSGLCDPFVKF